MALTSAIAIGAAVAAGAAKSHAANSARGEIKKGANKVIAKSDDVMNQTIEGQQGYEDFGQGQYGQGGIQNALAGDMSGFENSGFAKVADSMFDTGSNALRRIQASGGALGSGYGARDIADYRYNTSLKGFNDYYGALQNNLGVGINATNNIANARQNNLQMFNDATMGKAKANANRANVYGDSLASVANVIGQQKWGA